MSQLCPFDFVVKLMVTGLVVLVVVGTGLAVTVVWAVAAVVLVAAAVIWVATAVWVSRVVAWFAPAVVWVATAVVWVAPAVVWVATAVVWVATAVVWVAVAVVWVACFIVGEVPEDAEVLMTVLCVVTDVTDCKQTGQIRMLDMKHVGRLGCRVRISDRVGYTTHDQLQSAAQTTRPLGSKYCIGRLAAGKPAFDTTPISPRYRKEQTNSGLYLRQKSQREHPK